eukprot:7003900-Prymnesium_polylepis.1
MRARSLRSRERSWRRSRKTRMTTNRGSPFPTPALPSWAPPPPRSRGMTAGYSQARQRATK